MFSNLYMLYKREINTFNNLYFYCELAQADSTIKCTVCKIREYFRKNTQKEWEILIFLWVGDLFYLQLW